MKRKYVENVTINFVLKTRLLNNALNDESFDLDLMPNKNMDYQV